MKIDLHIHSTASDGSLTPAEILELIQAENIRAFSITDHDTVDGSIEMLGLIGTTPVEFITGVEISTYSPEPFKNSGSFHILGYGFDPNNPELQSALKKFQSSRTQRNPQILEKLNILGMNITMEEVRNVAGSTIIGRPHIARVLLDKGYIESIKEAFDTYLAKGKPAFVEKYRMDCKSAIKMIRDAMGIPVLAHPVSLDMGEAELDRLLGVLKNFGLLGIEAYYTNHPPEKMMLYSNLAKKHGLLVTGGSDFHGSLKDNISIGTGKGDLHVPYNVYKPLNEKIKQLHSIE